MQQHHRRAVTPDADLEPDVILDVDPMQREALEHVPIMLAKLAVPLSHRLTALLNGREEHFGVVEHRLTKAS